MEQTDLPPPKPITLEPEKRLFPPTFLMLLVILQERAPALAPRWRARPDSRPGAGG